MKARIVSKNEKEMVIQFTVPYSESMLSGEELLQESLNEAGCLATGEMLRRFDTDGSPIVARGHKMTSKGKIGKTYQTPYGESRIDRHIYQSGYGGRGYCPLDVKAGIVTTSTPKLAKMICSKYAEMGGPRVQKDLEENHGRKLSKAHVQNISETIGSLASVKESEWASEIPDLKEEVATATVGLDGTCMYMSADGYRQAMTGTIALYNREGTRLHTIYTAARPEFGKKEFMDKFSGEIENVKALYPCAKYVGLADGARDNWPFLQAHTSEQTVDYYHASAYLSSAANAAIRGKAQRQEWIQNQCHILKHESNTDKTLLELRKLLENKMRQEKKDKVQAAITYFENNGHRMNYANNIQQNIPIGSGVTEAACKVIVKQRMCNSGMKWKDKGASVVLTLRCLRYTESRWEQFWNNYDKYGLYLN